MFHCLQDNFKRALAREGVEVQIGGTSKTVLFRRQRNSQDSADWVDVYSATEDNLRPGNILTTGADNYLLVQRDHRENGVYLRYNAVRCNQTISLTREMKSPVPDEWGDYPIVTVSYFTSPAYLATQLTGLNKTAIGNVIGGNMVVIMPGVEITPNAVLQCNTFDNEGKFTACDYQIESIDSTDVFADNEGSIHGILRLQIKPQ